MFGVTYCRRHLSEQIFGGYDWLKNNVIWKCFNLKDRSLHLSLSRGWISGHCFNPNPKSLLEPNVFFLLSALLQMTIPQQTSKNQ